MNQADAHRMETYLAAWGFHAAATPLTAEVAVVNTCVVRQRTEDRAIAQLSSLAEAKKANPRLQVVVTGCLVDSQEERLKERFPHVDLFFKPQAFDQFVIWGHSQGWTEATEPGLQPRPSLPLAVMQGCDNCCTYCIVPLRRGREKSRPIPQIVEEVKALVTRGVKEVVLTGQSINAYGHDLPENTGLGELLREVNGIPGLARLRFLTSHPRDIDDQFVGTLASLDKVCSQLSLPVQSGDDGILRAMGRGYSAEEYRHWVARLRQAIPEIAISTDIIVGFPGEDEAAFLQTLKLVEELRLDTVHIAPYSPRPGTWAARHLRDDVPWGEKKRRQRQLEAVQATIVAEDNARLVGKEVEVLVEDKAKGHWRGRTKQGKLVFFGEDQPCQGRLAQVRIAQAKSWWLEGGLVKCE